MSRLFLEDGESVPVTAVSVCGNFVAGKKTTDKNGYNALLVSKATKSNNLPKAVTKKLPTPISHGNTRVLLRDY